MKLMNLLCTNVMTSCIMGRSLFTAFGCIDTRQFLKDVLLATARLFEGHFCISLTPHHACALTWSSQTTNSAAAFNTPSLKNSFSFDAFWNACTRVCWPFFKFSSTYFVALHDDALLAPSPYILLYKSWSDSEYAGDMMSYYWHGTLAAFHSAQQILHLPYILREVSPHHNTAINHWQADLTPAAFNSFNVILIMGELDDAPISKNSESIICLSFLCFMLGGDCDIWWSSSSAFCLFF